MLVVVNVFLFKIGFVIDDVVVVAFDMSGVASCAVFLFQYYCRAHQ